MNLLKENHVEEIPLTIKAYHTFFRRLKGLMFRFQPIVWEGIHLKPCNSIHMFFMFFSIDVVFLNDRNNIVFIKTNVKPWTIVLPKADTTSVLELPVGTITKYNIQVGDSIELP